MQIDAKEIEFINTKVDAEYPATINIKAERTRIEKSELKAKDYDRSTNGYMDKKAD